MGDTLDQGTANVLIINDQGGHLLVKPGKDI